MTKKTKVPAPLKKVTLFASVSHETWIKITTLAARLPIGRLELYNYAISWAVDQKQFEDYMDDLVASHRKKAKK